MSLHFQIMQHVMFAIFSYIQERSSSIEAYVWVAKSFHVCMKQNVCIFFCHMCKKKCKRSHSVRMAFSQGLRTTHNFHYSKYCQVVILWTVLTRKWDFQPKRKYSWPRKASLETLPGFERLLEIKAGDGDDYDDKSCAK